MRRIKSSLLSRSRNGVSRSRSPAIASDTALSAETSLNSQQMEAPTLTDTQQPTHMVASSSTAPERTEKYGLFPLSLPKTPSSDTTVDIVAVHGITGDAYNTWTEGEKLWLRDFLPKDFPGARVFSFGYPAEVCFSLGTGKLDTFARSLLEGLKRERRREEVCLLSQQVYINELRRRFDDIIG